MRAVIVVDRWFAGRETAMLSRLEIGLADEGYRVVHAMPVASLSGEQGGVYSTVAGYVDTGLALTLSRRVAALVETLEAIAEKQGDRAKVSVVHGLGGGAWAVAAELARQTGAALVIELDRASLIPEAVALATARDREGTEPHAVPYFLTPAETLRTALLKLAPQARARLARWGVHVPPGRRGRGESPAAALFIERGDSRGAQAALEALAKLVEDAPGLMIFAHVQDDRNAPLWTTARRLGLLDRLSLSPDMESRREPAMQMDAILMPDSSGTMHSIALDAMAAGMAVVAAPDDLLEHLRDGQTARLVARPAAADWEKAIRESVLDEANWGVLGATAREFVRTTHPVSAHIAAVLAAYAEAEKLQEADGTRRTAIRASATLR